MFISLFKHLMVLKRVCIKLYTTYYFLKLYFATYLTFITINSQQLYYSTFTPISLDFLFLEASLSIFFLSGFTSLVQKCFISLTEWRAQPQTYIMKWKVLCTLKCTLFCTPQGTYFVVPYPPRGTYFVIFFLKHYIFCVFISLLYIL